MKTLFGTVIYPGALKYADDFLASLNAQTCKDFTLLMISDGVPRDELETVVSKYNLDIEILVADEGQTPIQLRVLLLATAKENKADILIIGDIDDSFSSDRVEKILDTFERNDDADFVYNELLLPDETVIMPALPNTTETLDDILQYNYLGLSTTAIRINRLSQDFIHSLAACKTFVFDWYLYCRLVIHGMKGFLAKGAVTYYRIYDNNFAGLPKPTDENIEKEIYVKKNHFEALSEFDDSYKELLDAYNKGNYKTVDKDMYFWWGLTEAND